MSRVIFENGGEVSLRRGPGEANPAHFLAGAMAMSAVLIGGAFIVVGLVSGLIALVIVGVICLACSCSGPDGSWVTGRSLSPPRR